MHKHRIGIIGATADIAEAHIDAIHFCEQFELGAVCDLNEDKLANRFGRDTNIIKTTDYHELLNNRTIDSIVLCTPNHCHVPIALDALKAHKHVLCEKPAAVSLSECEDLLPASRNSLGTFIVSYHFAFFPEVQYLRQCLSSYGRIEQFHFESSEHLGVAKPWNFKKHIGGVWLDWAPNALSVLRQVLTPTKLSSYGIKRAQLSSCFDYDIETRANIELIIDNIACKLHIDWEAEKDVFIARSHFLTNTGAKIELDHATNRMSVDNKVIYEGVDSRYRKVYANFACRIASGSSNVNDAMFETRLMTDVFSVAG